MHPLSSVKSHSNWDLVLSLWMIVIFFSLQIYPTTSNGVTEYSYQKRLLSTKRDSNLELPPVNEVMKPRYIGPSFYQPTPTSAGSSYHGKKPYQVPIVLVYTVVSNVCKHGLPRYVQDVLQHTLQFQYGNELIFAANFYECPRLIKDLSHMNSVEVLPTILNYSSIASNIQDDRKDWDKDRVNNGVSSSLVQQILGIARFPLYSKSELATFPENFTTSSIFSSSHVNVQMYPGVLSAGNSSITMVDIHAIASFRTIQFINASKEIFLSDGKNELWFTSATRFLHLQDIMEFRSLPELIHIESDNLLYVDLSSTSQIVKNLRNHYPMAITPLVANLHILTASFFYVSHASYLNHLNEYFINVTVNKFAGSPYNESWRDYVNYLRRFEWTKKGGIEPNEWGQRIKPFAVNEMTMLAYYAETNHLYLRYLPVLPYYADYYWRKPFCDLKAHQPGGKFTGGGVFLSSDHFYPHSTGDDTRSHIPLASIAQPATVHGLPVAAIFPSNTNGNSADLETVSAASLAALATASGIKGDLIVKALSQYFGQTSESSRGTWLNTTMTTSIAIHLIKNEAQASPGTSSSFPTNIATTESALHWQPDLQVYRQPLSIDEVKESLTTTGSPIKVVLLIESDATKPIVKVMPWPLALSAQKDNHHFLPKVNPISIFSIFDPGSYGQSLGGTHKKHGRDKGFLDTSHIVGQSRLLSNCIPVMLCMNVSRPTRSQRLVNILEGSSGGGLLGGANTVNHCFTAPFVRCGVDLQYTPLVNLHVHSKNADHFASAPCQCP